MAVGADKSRRCARLRDRNGTEIACTLPATWRVGLGLRAYKDDRERLYMIDAAVACNCCRGKIKLSNFVDDRIFAYVSRQAVANEWPVPNRRLTRLVFEHIEQGYIT